MFEIKKSFKFEAGHQLMHHDGKCSEPHGHSYTLTIIIRGETLIKEGPKKNMITDFTDISTLVTPLIMSHLDHKWLNETLDTDSPTTEFIARWIYEKLKSEIPHLYAVSVSETTSSKVTYMPNILSS